MRRSLISGLLFSIAGIITIYFTDERIWHLASQGIVYLGWALILRQALGGADNHSADPSRPDRLTAEFCSLLESLSSGFNDQFMKTKADLNQMRGLLQEAAAKLSHNFTSLEANTRSQHELVVRLTNQHGKAEDLQGNIDLERFISKTSETLVYFVDNIVTSSKNSIRLVEKMEDISRIMSTILRDASGVEKVARQTKLLALNATIEASRAGSYGRSFAVVADEVRKLAIHSAELSERINGNIHKVQEALKDAEKATNDLASKDMNFALTAKTDLTNMTEKTRALNSRMLETMNEISLIGAEVESDVNSAVTALQFEDLLTQLVARISSRVKRMETMLNSMRGIKADIENRGQYCADPEDLYSDRISEIKETICKALLQQEKKDEESINQKGMSAGSVELF